MVFGAYKKGMDSNNPIVTRVIDGDTIELSTKQKIRLDNIEAPDKNKCGYEESRKKLEELALGKKVVKVEGKYVDQYGRLLGLVYTDDYLINLEMVKSGFAKYNSNLTRASEVIQKAGEEARENNLGIFEICRQENTKKNCPIKGNKRDGYTTAIYTFPGCMGYSTVTIDLDKGDRWFCSEEEAKEAGFAKAKNCFGKVWGKGVK